MELENVTLVKLASQYCQTFLVGKGVLKIISPKKRESNYVDSQYCQRLLVLKDVSQK